MCIYVCVYIYVCVCVWVWVCVCVCECECECECVCVSVSVCVSEWVSEWVSERERERERRSHHSGVHSVSEIVLITACLQTHTSIITVCHATLFLSGLNWWYINWGHYFWKMKLAIMERGVTFPTQLVVFSQSQCTVPVGQSEQTVLVGRRVFV